MQREGRSSSTRLTSTFRTSGSPGWKPQPTTIRDLHGTPPLKVQAAWNGASQHPRDRLAHLVSHCFLPWHDLGHLHIRHGDEDILLHRARCRVWWSFVPGCHGSGLLSWFVMKVGRGQTLRPHTPWLELGERVFCRSPGTSSALAVCPVSKRFLKGVVSRLLARSAGEATTVRRW